jgi:hypothetical protein
VSVTGGEVLLKGNRRVVEIRSPQAIITLEKLPGRLYPLALQTMIPADARREQAYMVAVSQRGKDGQAIGGAGVAYVVGRR